MIFFVITVDAFFPNLNSTIRDRYFSFKMNENLNEDYVRVAVRIRPPSNWIGDDERSIVKVVDEQSISILTANGQSKKFSYDLAFDENSTQVIFVTKEAAHRKKNF